MEVLDTKSITVLPAQYEKYRKLKIKKITDEKNNGIEDNNYLSTLQGRIQDTLFVGSSGNNVSNNRSSKGAVHGENHRTLLSL